IGQNEQLVAAVGERILHTALARSDQPWRRGRVGEINEALLRGFVVAARDDAETSAGTFMDMREPAGIVFLVNQNIIGLRHAQAVTPDLHGAMVIVELDVKEAFAIRAPYHGAVSLLDQVVKVGAIGPVAHAD